jgi:hypothetical protein
LALCRTSKKAHFDGKGGNELRTGAFDPVFYVLFAMTVAAGMRLSAEFFGRG